MGDAFAHYGRIFRTLHLLQFIGSGAYRRMTGAQPNIGEGRHALGRRIIFGRFGELRHGPRDGMEDRLGTLGRWTTAPVAGHRPSAVPAGRGGVQPPALPSAGPTP
ncbi:Tn3 family transposase [Streptomyces sp. BBFR102]|uniref:Tn3 family transposase n=1 Tax=Streptomyces sp. BBFR102 TaxID=3448171 RepID=UPI003F530231